MKLNKNIIAIIPAQIRNKYSSYGDLAPWGGTNLLEWKIAQARQIKNIENIYVCTPDAEIIKLCNGLGVETIKRKEKKLSHLSKVIKKKFSKNYILWLNTTSPFTSPKLINEIILKYSKIKKNYDSAYTCLELKDYIIKNNKILNRQEDSKDMSRENIKNFSILLTGFYLFRGDSITNKDFVFGEKKKFFKIDWLSSLEIKNIKCFNSYNYLIKNYSDQSL